MRVENVSICQRSGAAIEHVRSKTADYFGVFEANGPDGPMLLTSLRSLVGEVANCEAPDEAAYRRYVFRRRTNNVLSDLAGNNSPTKQCGALATFGVFKGRHLGLTWMGPGTARFYPEEMKETTTLVPNSVTMPRNGAVVEGGLLPSCINLSAVRQSEYTPNPAQPPVALPMNALQSQVHTALHELSSPGTLIVGTPNLWQKESVVASTIQEYKLTDPDGQASGPLDLAALLLHNLQIQNGACLALQISKK